MSLHHGLLDESNAYDRIAAATSSLVLRAAEVVVLVAGFEYLAIRSGSFVLSAAALVLAMVAGLYIGAVVGSRSLAVAKRFKHRAVVVTIYFLCALAGTSVALGLFATMKDVARTQMSAESITCPGAVSSGPVNQNTLGNPHPATDGVTDDLLSNENAPPVRARH